MYMWTADATPLRENEHLGYVSRLFHRHCKQGMVRVKREKEFDGFVQIYNTCEWICLVCLKRKKPVASTGE